MSKKSNASGACHIVVVVDTSGSVRGHNLQMLIEGLREVLSAVRCHGSVLAVGNRASVLCEHSMDFLPVIVAIEAPPGISNLTLGVRMAYEVASRYPERAIVIYAGDADNAHPDPLPELRSPVVAQLALIVGEHSLPDFTSYTAGNPAHLDLMRKTLNQIVNQK